MLTTSLKLSSLCHIIKPGRLSSLMFTKWYLQNSSFHTTNGNPVQMYLTSELEALNGELRCFPKDLGMDLGSRNVFSVAIIGTF